jgi:hypothetical protein
MGVNSNNQIEDPRARNIVIQFSGSKIVYVVMRGMAVRVSREVELPKLLTFWQQSPKLLEEKKRIRRTPLGNLGGLPVYKAEWVLPYALVAGGGADADALRKEGIATAVVATPDDGQGIKLTFGGQAYSW